MMSYFKATDIPIIKTSLNTVKFRSFLLWLNLLTV